MLNNSLEMSVFENIKDQKTIDILQSKKQEVGKLDLSISAKILIVSSWKNGCDLIGEIFAQHSGTFYHYEPLAWKGIKRFVDEFQGEGATNQLSSQLKCNFGPSLGMLLFVNK